MISAVDVKADPASGEAATGTEITLTSATEGAAIYYSIDGGEYKVYDDANKPVLEKLPAKYAGICIKKMVCQTVLRQFTNIQAAR